ncbi:MAG: PDDEXK nuclease domain-containing protein [Polaromonas sp.]
MDFNNYLARIASDLKAGNATEHTHRPALQTLLESSLPGIKATNEPRRIACGAPDYIVTRGETPIGYIEAKDVGVSLDAVQGDEQLKRYRASLRNLILTDYLEFRLYRNGELVQTAKLAQFQKSGAIKKIATGAADTAALIESFLNSDQPTIATPRELAQRMARMAQVIRGLIANAFALENDTATELHNQFDAFKQVLLGDDLTPAQFADMYAQTICYGLFAARCNHTGGSFSRLAAANELPKTNPFLRKLFQNIAGFNLDERIAWAVDDLADMLSKADMGAILSDFGKATRQEDPVVHFYETFLAAYDPRMREARGVYYTPEPVVSYIVRSVDAILKRDFGLEDGLADNSKVTLTRPVVGSNKKGTKAVSATEIFETHRVQILDPATGTGTFLYSVIQHIRERFNGNAGMWPGYVAEHLLPRIYGFELLMAPYAVAHMKLGLLLKDSGYEIGGDAAREERLRVYLFDFLTLEAPFHERELETGLIKHLEKFLLELGQGFAFVGRQYHVEIGEQDFYIDLLFYHLRLRCYIVIELKRGVFRPEYAGKMNFYCSVVDDVLQHEADQPTIGLILCQQQNSVVAEYALRGVDTPIGVSTFELTRALPAELASKMPSIEQIEQELGGGDKK